MDKINISIGNKKYKVDIADTEDKQEKGLQGVTDLPENEGMLFLFGEPSKISMWMKDTKIPLDIIFIDEEFEVISSYKGKPESKEYLTEDNVAYVLEVNQNSGIKKGDNLEFSPEMKVDSSKMIVLKEDGTPQMDLDGGERIFSRPNTKTLIKFAKKAKTTKSDKDYKALGKRVFKFIEVQDNAEPEYVS